MSMLRNRKGFTLVELMVVVIIVLVLAGIAVPVYIHYIQEGKKSEAYAVIDSIVSGALVYFQKNNTYAGGTIANFLAADDVGNAQYFTYALSGTGRSWLHSHCNDRCRTGTADGRVCQVDCSQAPTPEPAMPEPVCSPRVVGSSFGAGALRSPGPKPTEVGVKEGSKVSLKLRSESGISLMEVMVSVVVFSIAIVFLYQMLFSGRMQVEFEGERRVASKAAELKVEELKYAGYGSTDAGADWTSLSLDVGTHPADERIVLDDRGTGDTQDDLVGLISWAVRETTWTDSGIDTEAKVIDLTLQWPESWVRDEVRIVTAVAK